MGCNCGKKKGTVRRISTDEQARIARTRGGVQTSAGSSRGTKKASS